jgi:hypothetical protein
LSCGGTAARANRCSGSASLMQSILRYNLF